jgi:hypothetical protein
MDIRSLISKLDNIEDLNRQPVKENISLDDVTAAEKAAADEASAKKSKGGWSGFTANDPQTAGDIALAKLAASNNLPGLFNSKGEFVVADNKRMDRGPMGQPASTPVQKAPPTPSDWEPLAQMGLVPQNAKGPAGLTNFLSGGKAGQQFASGAVDKSRDVRQQKVISDLVAKATPLLDKLEQKYAQQKESISYTSGIARALAESIGYDLSEVSPEVAKAQAASNTPAPGGDEDQEMKQLADIMNQLSDIENDPKVKALQDRYAKLLTAVDASKKPAQSATPATDSPSTQDLTTAAGASGEAVGKKLQRFKDLLAKVKEKQSKTKTASAPGAGAVAGGAAGAANPLKNDPITASALPRKDGPIAKENMSESEIIAKLRQQLENIENGTAKDTEVDEVLGAALRGIGALGKGIMNVGKNFAGGLKGAATSGGRTATGQFAKASAPAKMANTAGKAIAKNPGKTSLATGVAGAGLGYALGGKPGDPSTTVVDTNKKPNQSATPVPAPVKPAPATPDADPDMQELDLLAREFGDSEDPEIAELLKQYSDVKNAQLK